LLKELQRNLSGHRIVAAATYGSPESPRGLSPLLNVSYSKSGRQLKEGTDL